MFLTGTLTLHNCAENSHADSMEAVVQVDPGFDFTLYVLPECVPAGYSGFLPSSKDMHVKVN